MKAGDGDDSVDYKTKYHAVMAELDAARKQLASTQQATIKLVAEALADKEAMRKLEETIVKYAEENAEMNRKMEEWMEARHDAVLDKIADIIGEGRQLAGVTVPTVPQEMATAAAAADSEGGQEVRMSLAAYRELLESRKPVYQYSYGAVGVQVCGSGTNISGNVFSVEGRRTEPGESVGEGAARDEDNHCPLHLLQENPP